MKDIDALREKVSEMATVMHRAVEVDERIEQTDVEMMTKLKCENKTLRELLNISGHPKKEIEKLKQKERLQEEKLLMNGDFTSSEERSVESSADEMEERTGTVKRRGKNPEGRGDNSGGSGSYPEGKYFESTCNRTPMITAKQIWQEVHERDLARIVEGEGSHFKGEMNGDMSKAIDDRSSYGIEGTAASRDESVLNENNSPRGTEKLNTNWDLEECSAGPDGSPYEKPGSVTESRKQDSDANERTLNQTGVENTVDGKRKQEDFVELYNSEGIFVEESEEGSGRKTSLGHDSNKISGLKIRRSTKQKKVIQADLKSYFEKIESTDRSSDGEDNEATDKSPGEDDIHDKLTDKEEIDHRQVARDKVTEQALVDLREPFTECEDVSSGFDIAWIRRSESEDTIPDDNEPIVRGNRIVNIDYNFSPPESPDDSPLVSPIDSQTDSLEFSEDEGSHHRTIQLDYSDSDSDDPEMMIEDQFADIGDECESSSNESDRDAGADELNLTEEELIGTLEEGNEYVISNWVRPATECGHLDENDGKYVLGELKNSSNKTAVGRNESDGAVMGEFAFKEAFLQRDQFTGGSIEAKYAKRKRYQKANRANVVTLLHENDAIVTRGGVRSDLDLTVGGDLEISARKSFSAPVIAMSDDSTCSDTSMQSSDHSTCSNATLTSSDSPTYSDSSLKSPGSSSEEIDPTIFMTKLSGKRNQETGAKVTSDLTDLLSDLDAALDLEDSDKSD